MHSLIVGLSFIALGFLVKAFPMLIAGYNTMSHKERAQVDIKGVSSLMRNVFWIMGLTIALGSYLLNLLGLSMVANAILPITIVGGVIIILAFTQKYNHNQPVNSTKKRPLIVYLVLGISFAIMGGITIWGLSPTKVNIHSKYIEITGIYGVDLYYEGVKSIELTNDIPKIKIRTNGFSIGSVNKGFYHLEEYGRSRLFLNSQNPPFIEITNHRDERIFINFRTDLKTKQKYQDILEALSNSKNRFQQ
jgi:hypothetical protein